MNIDPQQSVWAVLVAIGAVIISRFLRPLWKKLRLALGKKSHKSVEIHAGMKVTDEEGTTRTTELVLSRSCTKATK